MRKILTYYVVWILMGLLVSSCGSNLSFVKRHYNKGYYIDQSKNALVASGFGANKRTSRIETKRKSYSVQIPMVQNAMSIYTGEPGEMSGDLITASNDNKAGDPAFKRKETIVQSLKTYRPGMGEVKHKIIKTKRAEVDPTVPEAFSMFWIFILAIVAIWGVCFLLAFLGMLIHIMLVIALILFILWLLKIV